MKTLYRALVLGACVAAGWWSAGCAARRLSVEDWTRARFHLEASLEDDSTLLASLPVSEVRVAVQSKAILAEFDYESIQASRLEYGMALVFQLKPSARRAFLRLSAGNLGKRLVLMVDGVAVGLRRLDRPTDDGTMVIYLEMKDAQVEDLARKLQETTREIDRTLAR